MTLNFNTWISIFVISNFVWTAAAWSQIGYLDPYAAPPPPAGYGMISAPGSLSSDWWKFICTPQKPAPPLDWQVKGIQAAMNDGSAAVVRAAVELCVQKEWWELLEPTRLLPKNDSSDAADASDSSHDKKGSQSPENVATVVAHLTTSQNAKIRRNAIHALHRFEKLVSVPVDEITALLTDQDMEVRKQAKQILARMLKADASIAKQIVEKLVSSRSSPNAALAYGYQPLPSGYGALPPSYRYVPLPDFWIESMAELGKTCESLAKVVSELLEQDQEQPDGRASFALEALSGMGSRWGSFVDKIVMALREGRIDQETATRILPKLASEKPTLGEGIATCLTSSKGWETALRVLHQMGIPGAQHTQQLVEMIRSQPASSDGFSFLEAYRPAADPEVASAPDVTAMIVSMSRHNREIVTKLLQLLQDGEEGALLRAFVLLTKMDLSTQDADIIGTYLSQNAETLLGNPKVLEAIVEIGRRHPSVAALVADIMKRAPLERAARLAFEALIEMEGNADSFMPAAVAYCAIHFQNVSNVDVSLETVGMLARAGMKRSDVAELTLRLLKIESEDVRLGAATALALMNAPSEGIKKELGSLRNSSKKEIQMWAEAAMTLFEGGNLTPEREARLRTCVNRDGKIQDECLFDLIHLATVQEASASAAAVARLITNASDTTVRGTAAITLSLLKRGDISSAKVIAPLLQDSKVGVQAAGLVALCLVNCRDEGLFQKTIHWIDSQVKLKNELMFDGESIPILRLWAATAISPSHESVEEALRNLDSESKLGFNAYVENRRAWVDFTPVLSMMLRDLKAEHLREVVLTFITGGERKSIISELLRANPSRVELLKLLLRGNWNSGSSLAAEGFDDFWGRLLPCLVATTKTQGSDHLKSRACLLLSTLPALQKHAVQDLTRMLKEAPEDARNLMELIVECLSDEAFNIDQFDASAVIELAKASPPFAKAFAALVADVVGVSSSDQALSWLVQMKAVPLLSPQNLLRLTSSHLPSNGAHPQLPTLKQYPELLQLILNALGSPVSGDIDLVEPDSLAQVADEQPEFARGLVNIAGDETHARAQLASVALLRMKHLDESHAPELISMLQTAKHDVALNACKTLRRLSTTHDEAIIEHLTDRIKKSSRPEYGNARSETLDEIASFGAKARKHASTFFALISDKNLQADLRCKAVETMRRIEAFDESYLHGIAELLKGDFKKDGTSCAEAALAYLRAVRPRATKYEGEIKELLKSEDERIQKAAFMTLCHLKAADTEVMAKGTQWIAESQILVDSPSALRSPYVAPYSVSDQDAGGAMLSSLDSVGNASSDASFQASVLEVPHQLAPTAIPAMRARLYLWSGHDEDLLRLVAHLGKAELNQKNQSGKEAAAFLKSCLALWNATEPHKNLRDEMCRRISEAAQSTSWALDTEQKELLSNLILKLKDSKLASAKVAAESLSRVIERQAGVQWTIQAGFWAGVHLGGWLLLMFAYPKWRPVQTFCFWNPWFRRFFGFPYVGLVLRWVPWARRRLFLPFQERLVENAQLKNENWFSDCKVRLNDQSAPQLLSKALPTLRGQVVLVGDSGLGKTMYLRQLVKRAIQEKRVIAFLQAEDCGDGVLEALQRLLEGPARDKDFLRDLIFAGTLDICIDGLNQVSPETRAKVSQFMSQFTHCNVIVSTQPITWRASPKALEFRLLPLDAEQIGEFLKSREPVLPTNASLRGDDYHHACESWLSKVLESDLGNLAAQTLSNPLDATVAAELLASGKQPDLLDLRQQQYDGMAAEYRDQCGEQFPLDRVAEEAYQMRCKDGERFNAEGFDLQREYMTKHRLLIRRQAQPESGERMEWWTFRHDKILEFFLVAAFRGDSRTRRTQHMSDPRFRGVFLRLALVLPSKDAADLRESFINYAAETGDHATSDDFIRLYKERVQRRT